MEKILLVLFLISFGLLIIVGLGYAIPLKLSHISQTLNFVSVNQFLETCLACVGIPMLSFWSLYLLCNFFKIMEFLFQFL